MKKSEIAREFADAHKYDFDADYASLAGGEYGEVREIDNGSGDEFEIEIAAKDSASGRPYLFTWAAPDDI